MSGLLLAVMLVLSILGPPGQEQPAPFCESGRRPSFQFGFAALKAELGAMMGNPIECEHARPAGDGTLQATTTGLAYYDRGTGTVAFTNGFDRWALGASGLVCWTGPSTEPPADAASPAEGLAVTVLAIERGWRGDRFERPRPGMEFATVEVRLENGDARPRRFFRSDFTVVTANGVRWHSAVVRDPALDTRLVPGRCFVRGWLTFQVPAGIPLVELRWDPIPGAPHAIPLQE